MFHRFTLFIFIILLISCNTQNRDRSNESSDQREAEDLTKEEELSMAEWKDYENSYLGLSLRYPNRWELIERTGYLDNRVVVNIFKNPQEQDSEKQPVHLHESADKTYLAIWPKGIGTEMPSGSQTKYSEIEEPQDESFLLNDERSTAFFLENGQQWGAFLSPDLQITNSNWDEFGFVFVQAATDNFSTQCVDAESGVKIPMRECDPMGGDTVIKKGNVNQNDWRVLKKILQSITFTATEKAPLTDLIKVEQPLPNMNIKSPLKIRGTARGYWFFEGDFPIVLQDAKGKTIAKGYATASDTWMTEDFVPFEATLQYSENVTPDDERGYLMFKRANPSGLSQNDRTYSLPVLFPPKKR
ncbi:MAG: Gmad2 immunoglobulin-like domain-containing protein [Altibacter sp.]|nr:Gmad2 immunoglobulin-like domain-containing protein [Altibacter sp.]